MTLKAAFPKLYSISCIKDAFLGDLFSSLMALLSKTLILLEQCMIEGENSFPRSLINCIILS